MITLGRPLASSPSDGITISLGVVFGCNEIKYH